MKKLILLTAILGSLCSLLSCEDVIDVDLNTAEPKLVVEASLNWMKGTDGSLQQIKLSETTSYFSEVYPTVTDAVVTVYGPDQTPYVFAHQGNGLYQCADFAPEIFGQYRLEIVRNGTTYTATEQLQPVVDIATITQNAEGGFLGDQYEVRFRFLDPADQTNYYLTRFDVSSNVLPDISALSDQFFNGNYGFSTYSEETLQPGDEMVIQLQGISSAYYEYMRKILDIAGNAGGSPFSTPPSTVRGNVRNTQNANEIVLGYFRLSEEARVAYTVTN